MIRLANAKMGRSRRIVRLCAMVVVVVVVVTDWVSNEDAW